MKYLVIAMMLLPVFRLQAQNEEDVLRYARLGLVGSARSIGAGGAWGAVGADLSSPSLNPAGLGLYRRNEFMLSASIFANTSNSNYLNSSNSDSRTSFNIPNLGLVFSNLYQYKGKDPDNGIVAINFAFGFNRLNTFQDNIFYSGISKNSSITDFWAQTSNGIDKSSFLSSDNNSFRALAYKTYLIDTAVGKNNAYLSVFNYSNDSNYSVRQSMTIQNRGNMHEWYAACGLNVSNWLYLGGTVFIDQVNLQQDITYNETNISMNTGNPFKSLTSSQSITTTGSGVGAKLGFLISPLPFFRVGAAYSTPARINLKDNYSNSIVANYTSTQPLQAPDGGMNSDFTYQVLTPARLLLSAAFINKNFGILSCDYEKVDYSEGHLYPNSEPSFLAANSFIRSNFRSSTNLRIGGELKLDNTRVRLGYALMETPYVKVFSSTDITAYTLGFGTVMGDGFADVSMVYMQGDQFSNAYGDHIATIHTDKIMLTVGTGFRF